jgi:hypothetical protein
MSDNKLILHPSNPWAILQDPPQLVEALRSLGFVGAGFNYYGDLHYRPGPRFRELIIFRDPETASGPGPSDEHHVGLVETTARPTFLGAVNAQGPVCPTCQARVANWKEQLVLWQTERKPYVWHCPKCSQALALERLEWGATGGLARYSMEVCGVREGAAEPSPELLSFLQSETLERWRYFYYRL